MKILQVYKTYLSESVGGVERMMAQLTEGTAPLGAENRIFCLSKQPQPAVIDTPGGQVFRYRQSGQIASTGFSFTAVAGLRKLAQWADIIHYHYPWPFGDVLHFLCGVRKPALVTYHADIVRQRLLLPLYRPLQRAFLQRMQMIVATSPNYVASSPTLQAYASKVKIIPLGLDNTQYPLPAAEKLQQWRSITGERFFLFVGVLRYYKGLHTLLEACQRNQLPVVIAGAGPLEAELKHFVQQHHLAQVKFVGAISEADKIALLHLCTAFVFPSHLRSEAFGLALLEAAMLGKPMISCEIGTGTSYINIDQQTGFVIPPQQADALSAAMQALWDNPLQAQQMGAAAQQRYLQLFTAEKMCTQYYQLYQQLLLPDRG